MTEGDIPVIEREIVMLPIHQNNTSRSKMNRTDRILSFTACGSKLHVCGDFRVDSKVASINAVRFEGMDSPELWVIRAYGDFQESSGSGTES